MVVDGGATPLGVESTVIDLTGPVAELLRPGGVLLEDLEDVLGAVVHAERAVHDEGTAAAAPGRFLRHYAPTTPLVLTEGAPDLPTRMVAAAGERGVPAGVVGLDPDPERAARSLYGALREADRSGVALLFVAMVAPEGLGRAVNDRLYRAAHGRVVLDDGPATVERVLSLVQLNPADRRRGVQAPSVEWTARAVTPRERRRRRPKGPRDDQTTTPPLRSTRSGSGLLMGMIRACRPKQWAKNVLVFVAPAAPAYRRTQSPVAHAAGLRGVLHGVVGDLPPERHPRRRVRSQAPHQVPPPDRRGIVPVPLAVTMALVLFAAGVGVALVDNVQLAGIVDGYAVLTTTYSMFLKTIRCSTWSSCPPGSSCACSAVHAADVPVSDCSDISLFARCSSPRPTPCRTPESWVIEPPSCGQPWASTRSSTWASCGRSRCALV